MNTVTSHKIAIDVLMARITEIDREIKLDKEYLAENKKLQKEGEEQIAKLNQEKIELLAAISELSKTMTEKSAETMRSVSLDVKEHPEK